MPDRPGRAGPKYRHIADELRGQIAAGKIPVGDVLPSRAVLQQRYGVAVNTVERAVEVLRQDGLVESSQGAGTYVLRMPGEPSDDVAVLAKALDEVVGEVRQLRERVEQLETLAEQVRQPQPGE